MKFLCETLRLKKLTDKDAEKSQRSAKDKAKNNFCNESHELTLKFRANSCPEPVEGFCTPGVLFWILKGKFPSCSSCLPLCSL